jgi:hypothetical protein
MDDVLCVDVFKRARQIERDAHLVSRVADRAVLDGVAEVLTLEELHHHKRAALSIFAEIVDVDDIVVRNVAG